MGTYLNSKAPYTLYKSEIANPYFVDKSKLLSELFSYTEQGQKYLCITRPRRFGKTVMANMISAFFGKGKDCHSARLMNNISIAFRTSSSVI